MTPNDSTNAYIHKMVETLGTEGVSLLHTGMIRAQSEVIALLVQESNLTQAVQDLLERSNGSTAFAYEAANDPAVFIRKALSDAAATATYRDILDIISQNSPPNSSS